jgi:tRNA-dihydrouridine synthase
MLRLGPLTVDPPVVLAPMAGITNAPFRRLCREYGAGLYVSEMIGARGLIEGDEKTRRLAGFAPDETPRSIQLYGTDPAALGEAVAYLIDVEEVDHIDMNFGCPMGKVTRHGGGAALPWKRDLFRSIVRSAVASARDVPITVKFRKGIDDDHLTYLETGLIAEEEGAAQSPFTPGPHASSTRARPIGTPSAGSKRRFAASPSSATVTSGPLPTRSR